MPTLPIPEGALPNRAAGWNEKHRAAAVEPLAEPAGFVRELLPLLPLGPALDLACGTGRHALLLASRHQPVTALDSSEVPLEILEQLADATHCAVTHVERAAQIPNRRQGIQLWHAHLEEVHLPPEAFSLVLCLNYLQRSLFP